MSLPALLMQDFFVKLLEGMHDVVLHLNADLCITRPSMSLSALLMQDFFVMLLEGMHDLVLHLDADFCITRLA